MVPFFILYSPEPHAYVRDDIKTDTGVFEFKDPKLERSAGLTAADRKWMDDILTDVNENWQAKDTASPMGMQQ